MNTFKERVLKEIIEFSKIYKDLFVNKEYLIFSKDFKNQNFYILKCMEDNYMHLTGVKTNLKASTFFEKCYNGTITLNDIDIDSNKQLKGTIRRKIKALSKLDEIFLQSELYFQEDFMKNKITCTLATSDLKCTIGFIGNKLNLRPKTLLYGDELKNKNAIDLILVKNINEEKYSDIIFGEEKLIEEYKEILKEIILYPDKK